VGLGAGLLFQEASAQETPVVSFDLIEPDDAAAHKPSETPLDAEPVKRNGPNRKSDEPLLSFNFRFAPWEDVLTSFARLAGLTLDLNETPSGTFNYYDTGRYTPGEAIDILNGYLLQRGYVLVRRDRFLVCLNIEKGIPPNLVPLITIEQLPERGKNELLSVILPLENANADEAASGVGQLLGPQGSVAVLKAANSLVVTDIGSNLRLIDQLFKRGEFRRGAEDSTDSAFRTFELQHVRASEVQKVIHDFCQLSPSDSTRSAGDAPSSARLRMTVDSRTNRLLVAASSAQMTLIEQIVEAVDVEEKSSGESTLSCDRPSTVRVLRLGDADVIVIGRALESLSPRIKVSTTQSQHKRASDVGSAPAGEADGGRSAKPQSPTAPERQDGRDG